MRTLARLIFGAATVLALSFSGSAGPADYPVLFVHEYCSDGGSWDAMFQNLSRRRYGNELVRLYRDADGAIAVRGDARPQAATSFAIDFFDTSRRTFTPADVADVSIRRKVEELKGVIDYITTTTGHARVIVVAHGMGGLVGRAYVQGLGTTSMDAAIPYTSDISGLITIGTPHLGSDFSALPGDWDASCAATDTLNRREMLLTPGGLLDNMNQRGWPTGTRVDAISTYYSEAPAGDTDGLVTRSSQDVGAISNYWARHPEAHVWSQPLASRRVPGFESLAPHSAVIRTAMTAALVDGIVRELDVIPAAAIRPFETQGLPESAHPYVNNFDSSWSYTLAGNPSAIDVRFDPQTFVEWDYDFIHVMNGNGTPVTGSPFSGNDLGGRTIRIQGSTVRIRLTSDASTTGYGFRLASVNAATGSAPPEILPESSHPYASNYYGTWPYVVAGNPSAVDVTFSAETFVEKDFDFISITDSDYKEVAGSPFTGNSLAGRTIRVPGAGVWIELDSDDSVTGYGFKVTAVTSAGNTISTAPVTLAADGPTMANTVAAMIKGALEGTSTAANLATPPTLLARLVSLISPEVVYAQSGFTKNCPGGGSVRLDRVVSSGGRHTLSNSSATFTGCGFDAQRRNATMNGVLTLNGAWCPGQASCAGPGVSQPSTPISTTGSLNVADVGSVPFIGSVGPAAYSINLGCSGCIFQGAPDTPPTPNPNSCPATVAPTSVSPGAGGGSYTVSVTVGSTCPWTAGSNSGFISVTSGASGRGNGSVGFSVSANTGTARTGSLSIAGQTVSVSQAAGTTTTLNVTGNWTVTDSSSPGSGTMTLSQSGSTVTGTAIMPAIGGTIITNRVTGSVSGSTVALAHAFSFRVPEAGTTCTGTTNYTLQATNTRMTGPSFGTASCTINIPGVTVPQPPPSSVSGTATFTKQ